MIKREKKLSIPTLNRLNEEDENSLIDNQEKSTANKNDFLKKTINLNKDKTESYESIDKKINSIDDIFKLIPFCESSNILLDDEKRLQSLEQVLANRLIFNSEDDATEKKNENRTFTNKLSSAQYSTYLASSFENSIRLNLNLLQQNDNEKSKESTLEKEGLINLNSLNLTNECLNQFSIKRLLSKTASTVILEDKLTSIQNKDFLNLMNNAKKIRIINLTKNSLKRLPLQLLNMFENLELINLSDNNFESINLISLIEFSSLKEINLSNNFLKSFKSAIVVKEKVKDEIFDDEGQEDYNNLDSKNDDSSNPLFFRIERLDLANNQLKSGNCLIISKFKNLKYLNLSNNLIQLNATTPDTQLPWLKSPTKLKNLLELNLSKNNKLINDENSSTSLRNQSSLSSFSVNINNKYNPDSRIYSNNYTAYTSFKAPNSDVSISDKSQFSNNSISSKSISSLNPFSSFNCLTNLRKLDLSENNLYNMPNDIKDLKYLEELNLSGNKLMFIPNELTELKKLKRLLLKDNNLTELCETFCSYANFRHELIKLDLSKNQLSNANFSRRIGLFLNLIELNLSENQFDSIPNTLPKNLEYLNLNKNKIKSLMTMPMSDSIYKDNDLLLALNMDEISKRKSKHLLKSSILSQKYKSNEFFINNQKNESLYDQPDVDQFDQLLMPHVFFLRNLKILHLRENQIQDVPSDFGVLNSNLEFIDMSSNLLTQLSVSLCRGLGNSLKFLDLSSNRIREITDKIRELCCVEYLNLSHNRILKLNYEICNDLKSLKELYLNNNNIDELPLFSTNSKAAINYANDDYYNQLYNKSTSSEFQNRVAVRNENSSKINRNDSSNNLVSKTSFNQKSLSGKRKEFTFNLPNLKKIDISNNKLKQTFSIYTSFALSQNLIEINLSSNKIKYIDIRMNEKSNVPWAVELLRLKNQLVVDEDQIKQLQTPIYRLLNLEYIDLSNNDIRYLRKGGFISFLCELYKFAPNLNTILYDQQYGTKLGEPKVILENYDTSNEFTSTKENNLAINSINDDFYFDFDEYETQDNDFLFGLGENFVNEKSFKRNQYYQKMLDNLRVLDLSNNNLKNLPKFIYELKNLKEIYFNGNFLNKIPYEMYKLKNESLLEDEKKFENLKRLQELRIREENESTRKLDENVNDEEENFKEQETKAKNIKKINKNKSKNDNLLEKNQASDNQQKTLCKISTLSNMKLLSDTIEIVHFNSNKIEQIPEDLFSNFKNLKELKLLNNPLKEPPQESVCISSRLVKSKIEPEILEMKTDKIKIKDDKNFKNDIFDSTSISFLYGDRKRINNQSSFEILKQNFSSSNKDDLHNFSLPNLFFETNENLKPLQSYMIKYKNREGI